MAEPVTIAGQTFTKTSDGWVDQKTKVKAPEGLLKLLNNLQSENSLSEDKKKRVRIDPSRPVVKLGKTEYVWDLNGKVWIDKKTREASNPRFSLLIEATYQSTLDSDQLQDPGVATPSSTAAKAAMKDALANNMFATKQKTKNTKTGSGVLPSMSNIKINSPIVQMIGKLATIDGYLKQRLNNQKLIAANNNVMAREVSIEAGGQSDAEPVIDEEKIKEEAEKENKKSNGSLLAVAAIAAGVLVSQLEPVKEAFSSIVDFAKGIYGYFKDFVSITNSGLESINSMFGDSPTKENNKKSSAGSTSVTAPATIPEPSAKVEPSSSAAPAATLAPSSNAAPADTLAPSSSAPAVSLPNSQSTKPATTSSTSNGSTRVNNTSGSRSSAPSPTRSNSSPAASTSPSASATPVTPTPNDPFTAYNPSGGKLSNDPAIRDKAFSTSPQTNATPDATSEIPKNDIVGLGNYLIGKGADRSKMQHSAFGAVGEHSKNSRHYRGMAIDVNFPTNEATRLDALEPQLLATGYNTIWRKKGHMTHMHVSVGGPEGSGSGDLGGSEDGVFQQIVSGGVDLTKGAMEAIGNILRAGLGEMTPTSGSQLLNFNDTMSGNINKAAREKTSAIVDSKTPESSAAMAKLDPKNLNASSGTSTVQNMPTSSDKAGVEFYLTRMGFPKIHYTQTSFGSTLR